MTVIRELRDLRITDGLWKDHIAWRAVTHVIVPMLSEQSYLRDEVVTQVLALHPKI